MNRTEAVASLKSVLCDHDGKCCIEGSDGDRKAVDEALAALASDTGERGVGELVRALESKVEALKNGESSLRYHGRKVEANHIAHTLEIIGELAAALRAQPAGGGESCRKCRAAMTGMCNDCAAKVDEERGITQPQPVEGELPGMWSAPDFTGGDPDERSYAERRATPPVWQGDNEAAAVNDTEVICPNCCHQFRAIPMQVQSLLVESGHQPPFVGPPNHVTPKILMAVASYYHDGPVRNWDVVRAIESSIAALAQGGGNDR